MRRCEAIKQQHDQLRRGDGAEQGASDKVSASHSPDDGLFLSATAISDMLIPTASSGREAAGGEGPAPGLRRRAAGRERQGPALAAVPAEHLRSRGPEQQRQQQHL